MTLLNKRTAALLSDGYLPVQLPPPFCSSTLGEAVAALTNSFPATKALPSECESFSVARVGHRRRTTKLPNPISQFLLARSIAENWSAISKHLKRSRLSLSNPHLNTVAGVRSIQIPSLGELESERVSRSAGYRYALVSDVTQFFPSLYTHALPWALHTKAAVKSALKTKPRTSAGFGDDLDKHARNCQAQQTIGVPIGPDTSHILAEIVGVGIDLELRQALKHWPAGYRYVDDFALFFTTQAEADAALSHLNQALAHFELRPNEHKTRIVSIDALEVDSWVHELRHFDFSHTKSRQTHELHHFFQIAFVHASRHPNESVMKFALRRVAVELIRKDNWTIFESYLLRVANIYPDTLQLVAQFLCTYRAAKYPIDSVALRRTLESLLREHAPYGHHSEVAWALWIALDNGVKLSQFVVQPITSVKSSICALLVLHLQSLGLTSGKISIADLKSRCNAVSLLTEDWLLAYQAEKDKTFAGLPVYVAADPNFSHLLSNNVTFYDKTAKQKHLFTVRQPDNSPVKVDDVFDLEENPNQYLEFFDVDEEYID
jgi:Reverse transcriptase (RNA-dependent DNA polymerase)